MKSSLLLATFSLVALPLSTARAQEAPAQSAPRSSEISTLNNQLVPVGDQNRYLTSYRRWNVSTNPLGYAIGSYGLSASYAFHANVAVRADLNYYAPVDSDGSGIEGGIGAPIYFRKVYSGLFLEPGLLVRHLEEGDAKLTTYGPHVLLGYHWSWDSGLNVALAAGVGRNVGDKDDGEIFPSGYLRFGYAF